MDRHALERLGHYVVSRRLAGLPQSHRSGQQPAVHRAHPGRHRTRGAQGQPRHLRQLENKLGWAPGSIDTILAGGELNETVVELRRPTSAPLSHTSTDALFGASTEELLLELRRRIIAPRHRRHETWDWDGGLDPLGDWPEQG